MVEGESYLFLNLEKEFNSHGEKSHHGRAEKAMYDH